MSFVKDKIKQIINRKNLFVFYCKYIYRHQDLEPQKLFTDNRKDIEYALDFLEKTINHAVIPDKTLLFQYLSDNGRGDPLTAEESIEDLLSQYQDIKNFGFQKRLLVKQYATATIETKWAYLNYRKNQNIKYSIIKNETGYQLIDHFFPLAVAIFLKLSRIPCLIVRSGFESKHLFPGNPTEIINNREEAYRVLIENDKLRNFQHKIGSIYKKSVNQRFGDSFFYQGFDALHLRGRRPCEYRFDKYGLAKYLDGKMQLLDIGSNMGFFTLNCSKYVKRATGLELNEAFVEIANVAKKYLGNQNCSFIQGSFENFFPEFRYDFIVSAAVHYWIPLTFNEYIKKLHEICEKKGFILFEFHKPQINIVTIKEFPFVISQYFKIVEQGVIIDDGITERPFFILEKI